ncbi:WS/DGAT domain-containing protein [Rhodococcoides corynebacterioides]|uniref:WS/DGAT domain-containing protein n=1 Tax=Rhodococcoides corynebacterioides TaxID=53972 RepID=UPI001C9ABD48|nr:WS/DGAT domain-containing protein [Rhodococcus corynebacterioides]MBY6351803.1 DUF1298 domain-containing protein [Rhodococcus corynebacterioides]
MPPRLTRARLTAVDARMFWLSRRLPSDQFLLFAFDGAVDGRSAVRSLLARAETVADLCVRIRETPAALDYPYWVPRSPSPDLVRVDDTPDWQGCLDRVAASTADQVDAAVSPWRLHLFPAVTGVPGASGVAAVAVLQVAHALADGTRASATARALFAVDPPPPVRPPAAPTAVLAAALGLAEVLVRVVRTARRARDAAAADRDRREATASGRLPAPPVGRTPCVLSRPASGDLAMRCLVLPTTALAGGPVSVTAAALTAISVALTDHLEAVGSEVPSDLGAEVTVGIAPASRTTKARNAFHVAGVDLHPEVDDLARRAAAIADSLRERRRRLDHPAFGAGDRATEAVPAAVIRGDVARADLASTPATVGGHTVVSSVHRGPADLVLGGHRVLMTAGFPALSPTVGLTHGVHGIGDTVTLSVTTSSGVVDPDAYATRLRHAVERVVECLQ